MIERVSNYQETVFIVSGYTLISLEVLVNIKIDRNRKSAGSEDNGKAYRESIKISGS